MLARVRIITQSGEELQRSVEVLLASVEDRPEQLLSGERFSAGAFDVTRDGRVRRREKEVVRVENGATGVERSRESNRDWVIHEREVGGVLRDVERVREV